MFSDMTHITSRASIRVWVTTSRCLLFLFGLLLSGSASADIVPQTITAIVTETVVLPCRITVDGELPTLEWSKEGLGVNNITLLYRDGCETFGMKNPAFHYRTNLLLNTLKDGNISQIIYNLRVSDGGRYHCRTLRGKQWQVHAIIVLNVGATSKPELTVVPTGTEGVTLQCKAECWFPEPDITFHDDEEKEISAEKPTRGPKSTECFTVTRRAVVKTPMNRVTCKVHERKLNRIKNAEIYIPDNWMRSCSNTAIITGVVTCFVTGLIICAIVFLGDKNSCGRGQWSRNEKMKEADQERRKTERHEYSPVEEPSTDDCRASPDGTGLVGQPPSYNVSTGQDTSTMKTSEMSVVRRTQTLSIQSKVRPRSVSASPSFLLPPGSFQNTLSFQSNASESSETLVNEQENRNN